MSLLNLTNVPGHEICGLDGETLEWATNISNERYIHELGTIFDENLDAMEFPFQDIQGLPADIEQELDKMENDSIPPSSKIQMKSHANKFRNFLKENSLDENFESLPETILCKYLRFFYSKLETINGAPYAPASLICIRAGLQRYLSSMHREVNIVSGDKFGPANRMLKAMVGKYLSSKQRKPEEKYPPIEEEDMIKIRSAFTRATPSRLQQEFIFNCLFYFGLRGRETLKQLDKDSIELAADGQDRRYLRLKSSILSKNCKASLSSKEFESAKKVRVYECVERKCECPVECYLVYMDKLPSENPSLFPKPLAKASERAWFCSKKVLGKNLLGNLLADISQEFGLSKKYTNHCVRVTTVQVLKEQGYKNEDIALVTGHKNPNSVQHYVKRRRDDSYFHQSKALQSGSSATVSQKVIPVGKSGKIVVHEDKRGSDVEVLSNSQTSITFSGQFRNCNFNIRQ